MRIRIGIVIWQFMIITWSGGASAANVEAKAKSFYEQGKAEFEAGRFEDAMAAFTEAYNLTAEPKLLFNLAACAEGMKDKERAKAYYQVYLEELPDAEDANDVRARIEKLSKEPTSEPVPVTEPEAKPAAAPKPDESIDAAAFYNKPQEKKKHAPIWPAVTIGVGGMTLAAGMITAILAKTRYDGLESTCKPNCTDDQVSTAKAPAVAADVLFGVGGAAVITGVVGLVLQRKHKEHKTARRPVTVTISQGALFGMEGSF